jgi:hypothetical protein
VVGAVGWETEELKQAASRKLEVSVGPARGRELWTEVTVVEMNRAMRLVTMPRSFEGEPGR